MQLHRAREEFDAAGVPLVLIGQATPKHAASFRRKLGIELPVLADGDRSSYNAVGAKIATFGELVLPDHDGRPTRLGDLWADRPAVLVWMRHYG